MTELKTTRDDLPNVSSSGINASAKMIWQAVKATDSFVKYASPGRLQGIPGKYWQGAVNQIINDLWPALNDRYLTEKEEAENLKLGLNRFLKYNRAMVCTRDGGLTKKSMWFVAEHWPELTVTPGPHPATKTAESEVVTDAAATAVSVKDTAVATPLDVFNLKRPAAPATATEERSEEAMTPTFQEPVTDSTPEDDDTVYHKCRLDGCEEKFEGVHHRATHEMRHGFRYNEDGTVTHFDPNDSVPDEEAVQDLIVKVCQGKEPMNTAQIVEAVRKDTPKASSTTIKIVLQVLTDDGWFEYIKEPIPGQRGHTRRFRFVGEPVKRSRKKPVAQAVDEKLDALTDDGGFTETDDRTGSRVERYRGLFEDLQTDLAELDSLREALAREKAIRADVEKNLDTVIKQRDELQGKLDTLKQVFGTALQ